MGLLAACEEDECVLWGQEDEYIYLNPKGGPWKRLIGVYKKNISPSWVHRWQFPDSLAAEWAHMIKAKGAWAHRLFCHFLIHKNFPWAILDALSPSASSLETSLLPLRKLHVQDGTQPYQPVPLNGQQSHFLVSLLPNPKLLRTVTRQQELISSTSQTCVSQSVSLTGTQTWTT